MPSPPLRPLSELSRRLSEALLEGAGEGFRPFVSAVERDLDDRIVGPERQPVGRPLEPRELHVSVDADAEQAGELPMEVEFRERGDAAQHVEAQIIQRMFLDMIEHPLEPGRKCAMVAAFTWVSVLAFGVLPDASGRRLTEIARLRGRLTSPCHVRSR